MVGMLAGTLIGLFVGQIDGRPPLWAGIRGLAVGLLIGIAVGVGEEYLVHFGSRRLSFFALNSARIVGYGTILFLVLLVVNGIDVGLQVGGGFVGGARSYIFEQSLKRDFVLSMLAVVGMSSALEVRTLHNRGELWRFLTGRYRYPSEETRLFLFADMVGSTALAEQLGNLEYSSLLREVFQDTSEAILAWRGDVYQFAGDGVIVTWRHQDGLKDAACVRCFFEMVRALNTRAAQYAERYNTTPRLRAGVHGGDVVTTWVGEAKKELAFHGDALNATARIAAHCREAEADCLISQWVFDRVELPAELSATPIGSHQLRGKRDPVGLFSVGPRSLVT